MKSQIFLGSSKEGLKYLPLIESFLEPIGDVHNWTTAFTQNKSALDSLVRKTKLSEFAILVATCDDLTMKRDKVFTAPRDNIIFEFGLFTGAMGIDRAFLLAEEGTELPSDLAGITIAKFSPDISQHNSLEKMCAEILDHIKKEQQTSQLGWLPSTALAIGYYHSFVKGVCKQISDSKKIRHNDVTIRINDFTLQILIPSELDDNGVVDFKKRHNADNALVEAQSVASKVTDRGYPFHFKANEDIGESGEISKVNLYDIPTTLNTVVHAAQLLLPSDKIGHNSEQEYLEQQELANFAKVLNYLVSKNSLTRKHVLVISNVVG